MFRFVGAQGQLTSATKTQKHVSIMMSSPTTNPKRKNV